MDDSVTESYKYFIPRKESGGEVISASRVRKFLETKDFESIAKLVPETTLNYLREKFK